MFIDQEEIIKTREPSLFPEYLQAINFKKNPWALFCYGVTRDSTKNLFVALPLEALTTFRILLACLSLIQ